MLTKIKPRKRATKPSLPRATARILCKVIRDLQSDDVKVRAETLYKVRRFALPEVVDLISSRLRRDLTSRNEAVRSKAAETLFLLGPQGFGADKQPRSASMMLLIQSDSPEQRLNAVRYIQQVIDTRQRPAALNALVAEIRPALLLALHDADGDVRQEAGGVIKSLGPHAEPIIDLLWQELRQQGEELPRHLVLPRMVLGPKQQEPDQQQGSTP